MKRHFLRQLQKLEERIPYESLKGDEATRFVNKLLTHSTPEKWEWILDINPKELKEVIMPSLKLKDDRQYAIHFFSKYIARTRGWDSNDIGYVGFTDIHWKFSLQTASRYRRGNDAWDILYLMGLTPAQFAEVPHDKREAILVEARKRVETRFQELGQKTIDDFRHPKELFQAIGDLNLPKLYKPSGN